MTDHRSPWTRSSACRRLVRELFLLLGADAVANMPTWRRLEETRELAAIAVVERAGEYVVPPGSGLAIRARDHAAWTSRRPRSADAWAWACRSTGSRLRPWWISSAMRASTLSTDGATWWRERRSTSPSPILGKKGKDGSADHVARRAGAIAEPRADEHAASGTCQARRLRARRRSLWLMLGAIVVSLGVTVLVGAAIRNDSDDSPERGGAGRPGWRGGRSRDPALRSPGC